MKLRGDVGDGSHFERSTGRCREVWPDIPDMIGRDAFRENIPDAIAVLEARSRLACMARGFLLIYVYVPPWDGMDGFTWRYNAQNTR